MTVFPMDHVIQISTLTEAVDDFGDSTRQFEDPVDVKALGWTVPVRMLATDGTVTPPDGAVLTADWDLTAYIQAGSCSIGDRATVDGKTYTVTDIRNFDAAPTGWLSPGIEEVGLKEVAG